MSNIKKQVDEYAKDFEKEIDRVLSGETKSVTSEIWITPDNIHSYLEQKGFDDQDFDSNGWDYDFWMTYTFKDKRYTLSGSGWYGSTITFGLDTDD